MENFYKKIDNKKKRFDSFNKDLGKGDFYLYLIEKFIPRLINDRIDSLELQDIPNLSKIDDIEFNYNIHFFREYEKNEPFMLIDKDYVEDYNQRYKNSFMYIFNDTYDYVVRKFSSFCEKDGISKGLIFDNKTSFLATGIIIRTTLKKIIYAYFNSYYNNSFQDIEINENNILTFLRKSKHSISSLNDRYATIHAKYFEEEFLDKIVVGIIKKSINSINQRNYQENEIQDILIEDEVYLNIQSLNDNSIVVSKEELDALILILKGFMDDYNLGYADYFSNNSGIIRFNTNLKDLIDAYYMEKQRIEQYNSSNYYISASKK